MVRGRVVQDRSLFWGQVVTVWRAYSWQKVWQVTHLMTPVLSAPETGLPDVGDFQGTRIHLPLRYLTVQSWCWCFQTFWALHGQQHGLLRGSPKSLTTCLPKKAVYGSALVFPKQEWR